MSEGYEYEGAAPEQGSLALPAFLADPGGILRRRWGWMLLTALIVTIPAVAVVLNFPLQYEAQAKILVSNQRIPQEMVRSTISESIDEQINAMVAEVLSRQSLSELIENTGLDHEVETREEFVARVRDSISIQAERAINTGSRSRAATIYAISVRWSNPQTAANIANRLVGRLTEANLRRRSEMAGRTTEFLERAHQRAEQALHEHGQAIANFRQQHRGELPSELASNLSRLERLQRDRQQLALQISDAQGQLLMLQSQESRAESAHDDGLDALRAALARERAAHTDEHPNIRSLERQIAELESVREEERAQARTGPSSSVSAAITVAKRRVAQLQEQHAAIEPALRELEGQIQRTPERGEQLSALLERETVLRENYTQALRKVSDAELAENLERTQQGAQLSRVESAQPPASPKIARWHLALAALLLILGLPVALALGLELIDPVMLSDSQLARVGDLPVLGTIPRVRGGAPATS